MSEESHFLPRAASVLLDRIREEKAHMGTEKKTNLKKIDMHKPKLTGRPGAVRSGRRRLDG